MANIRIFAADRGPRQDLYAGVVHVDKRESTIQLTFRNGDFVLLACHGRVEIDHDGADP